MNFYICEIRFSKIVITSDQDLDGYGIRALLLNAFYKFWPELFELNVIHLLKTPIIKIKWKKEYYALCLNPIVVFVSTSVNKLLHESTIYQNRISVN